MRVDLKNSIYQKVWNSKSLRERYTERYKNVLREEIKRNLENAEQKSALENEVKETMRKEVNDNAWLWRMKYEEEVKQTIKKENVDNEEALRKEMREKEKALVAELEAALKEKEKALTEELESSLKEKERKMRRELETAMNKRVVNDMHLKEEQIRREQQIEMKLRVAAEMKDVEEKMKMGRMEEIRQEVENSVLSHTESLKAQKEKELMEKTVSMEEQSHDLDESRRLEIMKECEDSLRQDVEAQLLVDEAFIAKIKEEVRERVKRNMMDTETGAIRDDIGPEVEDEIRLELLHEMRKDEALMCKLRQEMEDYLRKEIRNNESMQVTDSLVLQSQSELKQSIYNEMDVQALRLEIRNELYADISEKEETGLREEIRNELIEKLKRDIEKEESLTQQIHKRLQEQTEKDIRSRESDQIEAEVRRGLERQYKAKYEADMMKSIQEEVSGAREKRFRELEEEMELSLDKEMNDRKEKLKYEIEMEFRSEIEKETADKEDDIKEDILNRMKKEIREEIEKERQTIKDQMFKREMEEYNARLDADLKDMQRELYDEKSVLVEQQVDEEVRQLMEEYKYIKEEELDQWKEDYENARMAEIKEKVDEDLVDIEGKLKDTGEAEIKTKMDKYMKTYEEKQKKKIEETIDKKYANVATKEGKGTSNKPEKVKTSNEAAIQSDNTSDEIDSIVSSGSDSEGKKKGQKKKKSFLKSRPTVRKEEGIHKPNDALGSEGKRPTPTQLVAQDPMSLAPATIQGTGNADVEKKQHVPAPAPTGRPLGRIKKVELEAPPVLLNRRQKMADPAPLHKPNHMPVPAQKATPEKGSGLPVSVDPRAKAVDQSRTKAVDQSKGKPSTVTYTHPYGSPRELPAEVACEYVDADGNPVDPRMMMDYGYGYPEPPPGVEFEYVDQYGRPVNPQDMAAPGYGYANEPPPDNLAPNRDDSHGMYSSRQKKLMAEKEMFGPTEPKSTIPTQSVQAPNKTMLPKSGTVGAFDAASLPSTRNMGPSNKALVPLEEPLPSKQKKKKKKKKEKSSLSDDIDKVLDMPPIGRRGIDFDPLGLAGKDSVKVPDASPLNKRGAAFDPLGLATKAVTDKPTQQENNNRPRDAIDILASRFGPSNNTLAPLQGPEFGSKGGPLASIGTTRNGSTKPSPQNMQNTNDNTPNADKTKGVSFNLREYNLHWNEPKEWVDKSPEKSILKMDENTIINVDPTQLYEDSSVLTSDEGSKQNGKVVRIGDNDKETYYSSESDYGAPDIDLDDDDVAVMFRKKDNMDDDFNANARRVASGRRFGRRQMSTLTNARNGKVP